MLGDSIRRRHRLPRQRGPAPTAPTLRWSRWILGTILALPLCFGVGYAFAVFIVFPVPEETGGDTVAVPRLIGDDRTEAETALKAAGLVLGEVMSLPHRREPTGTVLAQAPLPGQRLRPGSAVRLAVSSGRQRVVVPDVVGLPVAEATAFAERIGFTVNRREEEAPGRAGMVLGIRPPPGTAHDLPAAITLIVSVPPPPPPEPATVFPADSISLPGRPAFPSSAPDLSRPDTTRRGGGRHR
ncbi:MAG TPA: PASTA domain-containing protein [Longimicrobiales bacterium]